MKPATYDGYWWVPTTDQTEGYVKLPASNERLAGSLTFSPEEGAKLKLMGSFTFPGESRFFGSEMQHIPFIYGFTMDGKGIVLQDCQTAGPTLHLPGIPFDQFLVTTFFVHDHGAGEKPYYFNPNQTAFDRLVVSYTYLLEWVGLTGMREQWHFNKEGNGITRVSLSQGRPRQKVRATFNSKIKVEVAYAYGSTGDGRNERSFEQEAGLVFDTSAGLTFDGWYRQVVKPVQNLLTFTTNQPNSVKGLKVALKPQGAEREQTFFDVYYASRQYPNKHKPLSMSHEAVFMLWQLKEHYGSLGEALTAIGSAWLEMSGAIGRSIDHLLRFSYEPDLALERAFIELTQAAESFHRWKFASKEQADAYDARKKVALSSVEKSDMSKEDKDWIVARLTGLRNDVSFTNMISELITMGGSTSATLVGAKGKTFVREVVKDRNTYIHISPAYRKEPTDIGALYDRFLTLWGVLRLSLLHELAERIETAFLPSEEYAESFNLLAGIYTKSQVYQEGQSWLRGNQAHSQIATTGAAEE